MSQPAIDAVGEVNIVRYVDHDRNVMVAHGRFGPFLKAFVDHTNRWETDMDGLTFAMMRQALAGTVLHLSCRPIDESLGLTVNFKKPPVNVFLAGDARTATVTGRAFTEGVQTAETSRLYMQVVRGAEEPQHSVIEVEGLDLLDIYEQYYRRSVQTISRFFELEEENHMVMVQALPDADTEWLDALDRDRIDAWLTAEPRAMHERVFRFHCGCSPVRMLGVLRGIFSEDPKELFQGETGVESLCPRCGTRWWVTREDFDNPDITEPEDAKPDDPQDA